MPTEDHEIRDHVKARQRIGKIGEYLFLSALIIGIVALVTLMYNQVNNTIGIIAVDYKIAPEELSPDQPLDDLPKEELIVILEENTSAGRFRKLGRDQAFAERSQENVLQLVYEEVVEESFVASFPMWRSFTDRAAIEAEVLEDYPDARFQWHSWINWHFLTGGLDSNPQFAGIRTAILGSLYMIAVTMIVAVPLGLGAAVYLEEYARPSPINRMIETNINNLAGVPSIIYGMLGLAIFVRALEILTSGAIFGVEGRNGRTIISAALTMALLILPILIVNAREAIRAVSPSIREASYGLGATKWQTTWNHVLPIAIPGILTGTILAMSRAIGETAPLILIGASTFLLTDPDGLFSNFTVLPIQIYFWTSQPNPQYRNLAAAAIIVLLILLLLLNTTAILLRNRFRRNF